MPENHSFVSWYSKVWNY